MQYWRCEGAMRVGRTFGASSLACRRGPDVPRSSPRGERARSESRTRRPPHADELRPRTRPALSLARALSSARAYLEETRAPLLPRWRRERRRRAPKFAPQPAGPGPSFAANDTRSRATERRSPLREGGGRRDPTRRGGDADDRRNGGFDGPRERAVTSAGRAVV